MHDLNEALGVNLKKYFKGSSEPRLLNLKTKIMESQIKKKSKRGRKKENIKADIIALHGYYKPTTIARRVGCSREYVYMVWKLCGMDPAYRLNP